MFMVTKHLRLFLLLFLSMSSSLFACNGGCPSGGGYLGIVPQFSKNFVGLRYRYRGFSVNGSEHGQLVNNVRHSFQTTELWGRFYPAKRIQLFVFLPFQMNTETEGKTTSYLEGIGDVSFIATYNVINTGDSLDQDWKHNLLLGGGLKLPTGKYQQRDEGKQMYPIYFQSGTGAYSVLFNAIYTVRYNKIGLNTDFNYRYNGKNELDYSFGNLMTASASLFYWLNLGSVAVLPSVGTYIENAKRDIEYGYYLNDTGGTLGYVSLGADIYSGRLAIGVNIQKPYWQDTPLRNQKNDLRAMANVAWLF